MRRIPIFSVHSKDTKTNMGHRRISGRALNELNLGDKVYVSDSELDENYGIVEEINTEDQCVSNLGVIIKGVITINFYDQYTSINDYLYGEVVEDYISTIIFEQAKLKAEECCHRDLI